MWKGRGFGEQLTAIRNYLLPGQAERDEGFRREVERIATFSLIVVGGVQIGVSLFMLLARFLLAPESAILPLQFRQAAMIIGLGIVDLAATRLRGIGRWARLLGIVSAFLCAAVLIWASLVISSRSTNPNDFIPGQITLVMLVAVTTAPLLPMQTLALGLAIGVDYVIATTMAQQQLMEGLGPDDNYVLFIIMLTLLCTGITAVVYAQRRSNYEILQQTVEAGEALRQAQNRILMTESAASLSRLAAAVSHEMNTPLGALLSGIDTMMLLTSRQVTSKPEEQPRLVRLQADVRASIKESAQRLKELVARMQRFTYLDQAEVQPADVNSVIKDVAALVAPELKETMKLELRLEPIAPVVCHPQQISIVFSSLINNALTALNGSGRILVTSRQNLDEVEVEIEDDGKGISQEERENIFDPGFRVSGGRVATGNWSMFNSRQIVREHGGDIRIASSEGQGTRVTVTLPVEQPAFAKEAGQAAASLT
ncbi:MAG: HAMP domain-containing histidine kinase [Acidobacteriota bacterium]|nr:HAMP domain-containing histidine kinase [Acidobacteriota bacterium]